MLSKILGTVVFPQNTLTNLDPLVIWIGNTCNKNIIRNCTCQNDRTKLLWKSFTRIWCSTSATDFILRRQYLKSSNIGGKEPHHSWSPG